MLMTMIPYKVVLGLDRLPSYSGFSLVLAEQSRIILKKEVVSKEDVLELVRLHKVDAVAIDNIYELGSEQDIKSFMSYLYNADLIQITGSPIHGFKPLSVIGRELGITRGEKLFPLKSAEVCARAVFSGQGFVVKLFDPETRVTISRRRSFGPGGMSAGRFRRSVQGAILSLAKGIESALRTRGIDYDLSLKKGSHGIESASFIIYAPRNQLSGIIRPLRTSSVNVKITPLFSRSFDYAPIGVKAEQLHKRHLIVGVDPGMVSGLAVLDLNGNVVHLSSGRGISRGQITRIVASLGRALIFASDVRPPPSMVLKLSASHNAITYFPEQSLRTSEKLEIVEKLELEQKIEVADSHQRDALSAAFKAYSFYKNKLEQCASHVKELGVQVNLDDIKAQVIKGMSIKDAIASSTTPPPDRPLRKKRKTSERELINVLESKLLNIQSERDSLSLKVKALEEKIEELELELRLAKRKERVPAMPETYEMERRIGALLGEVAKLRADLESEKTKNLKMLSEMASLASGVSLIFYKYPSLKETLRSSSEGGVLVKKAEPLNDDLKKELKRSPPKFIIVQEGQPEVLMFELEIPVIPLRELTFTDYSGFVIVEKSSFERAMEVSRQKLANLSTEKKKKIKAMFEEYQLERMRELNRA
jgi:predicted RNase H-like nuclease (RuvC/YqgF family)